MFLFWLHVLSTLSGLEAALISRRSVGTSFEVLQQQPPAEHMSNLGGSSITCSPEHRGFPGERPKGGLEHLQSCLVKNVCLDMTQDYKIGPNSYRLETHQSTVITSQRRGKGTLSRRDSYRKLYFPRSQRDPGAEAEYIYHHLQLPFMKLFPASSMSTNQPLHYFIKKPIVMFDPQDGANYGHMYVDYILSAFAGARQLGLNIEDFVFMPNRIYSPGASLTVEKHLFNILNVSLSHDLQKYVMNPVCFAQVLFPGYHGIFSNFSDAATKYSRELRDSIYHLHPLQKTAVTPPAPKMPKIVIAYKSQSLSVHGGRLLLNIDDVLIALKQKFSSPYVVTESAQLLTADIHVLDLGTVSFDDQVALMRCTRLFVSPIGGSAFAAHLLPDGAVFLQIQSFNSVSNRSEPIAYSDYDSFLKLDHIKVLQHTVKHEEMIMEKSAKATSKMFKYSKSYYVKTLGNYRLDIPRFLKSIDHALHFLTSNGKRDF